MLATGTPRKFAEAIAAHLGLFDAVLATDGPHNLTSGRKRAALVEAYGDGGFDYAGNSRHDLKVFDAAREAIVVAPDRHAARWQAAHGSRTARDAEADLQDRPEDAARPSVAEELADRRADGAVARIFQRRHARRPACWPSSRSAPPPRRSTSSTTSSTWRSTAGTRPSATGPSPAACCRCRSAWRRSAVLLTISFVHARLPAAAVPRRARRLSGRHHRLFAVGQAHAAARRADARRPLHDAHPRRRRRDRRRRLVLAARLLDLLLPVAGAGEALRRAALDDARAVGERIAGRGYRAEDQEIVAQAGMASAFSSALVLALYIDSDAVRELYHAIRGWCGRWRRSCSISPCASGSWRGATRCMTTRSSSSSATGAASCDRSFGAVLLVIGWACSDGAALSRASAAPSPPARRAISADEADRAAEERRRRRRLAARLRQWPLLWRHLPERRPARIADMRPMNRILAFDAETGVHRSRSRRAAFRHHRARRAARLLPGRRAGHAVRDARRRHRQRRPRQEPSPPRHVRLPCRSLYAAALRRPHPSLLGRPTMPRLFAATIGGMGLTGIILSASIRLMRVPSLDIDEKVTPFRDLAEFFELAEAADAGNEYAVAWIDQLAGGQRCGPRPADHRQSRRATALARAASRRFAVFRCRSSRRSTCSTARSSRLFNAAYRWQQGQARGAACRPAIRASSFRSTACATGTGSTGRAGCSSTRAWCRTKPPRASGPGAARFGARTPGRARSSPC